MGHESEVENAGDYRRRMVAGRPIFFSRDQDCEIRVFLNTCPHRGAMICRRDEGNAKIFQCFYHAWSFNSQGELVGMPDEAVYGEGFDRKELSLSPPPIVASYRGFYFLSYNPEIEELVTYLAGAKEYLDLFTEDAKYVVPATDLPDGEPQQDLVFIDDDRLRLQGRVNRLKSRHAHREYPSSRTRWFITNIMVEEDSGDDLVVTASAMVCRIRQQEEAPYIGSYTFKLKRINGELKIHHRRAVLDQEELRSHGALGIIF